MVNDNKIQHMPTSGGSNVAVAPASSGEGRKISCKDIQLVQNLIERCLQLYMNQSEVICILLKQAKIEPGFTSLVWQKLEEQNRDFFKAYYIRLKLKRQIMSFNLLLEQQVQLMQKMHPAEVPVPSFQNGVHPSQVHHVPIGYPIKHQPSILAASHPLIVPIAVPSPSPQILSGHHLPDSFSASKESSGHNCIVDMGLEMPLHSTGSNMLPLSNELGMGSATLLPGNFLFTAIENPTDLEGSGMDVPTNIPLDAPFTAADTDAQSGIGTLHMTTDADSGVGVLLGHLPRNFSLSDLTAEPTNSSDILGSYSGSPFLAADADIYVRFPERLCLDDEKMLDDITDPLIYEEFVDVDVDEE